MSDTYAEKMGRDAAEARRLDEQFELLTRNIGYVLHPETIAQLTPESRVADIGTGTGIFLEQLHIHHPETTLDGFDISTALFPAQSTLPSQISLRQLDIKQPIPQELQGQYDVVHVQMLAAGMLPSEWELVVRNVVLLLKPGGWLQWTECDFLGVKHLSGHPRATVETARRMGRAFRDALKERFGHGWNSLPADMEAAGLASIRTDLLSSDRIPETREKMTANGMQAILSWARRMAEPGTMTLEELNKAEAQAYEDIRSGCYVRFDVYVTRGRKVHTTG